MIYRRLQHHAAHLLRGLAVVVVSAFSDNRGAIAELVIRRVYETTFCYLVCGNHAA